MTMPTSGAPDRPVLFLLHYLGGSAAEWGEVASLLEPHARCVAVDLPGFGGAPVEAGTSIADMAGFVAARIAAEAPGRWALIGHSMGAKVAAVIARRAEDGDPALAGLIAASFLAGSPPGPEPMEAAQRQTMLGWLRGDAETTARQARDYIAANTGRALSAEAHGLATADLLRTSQPAWQAWLEHGSREDWSGRIGALRTPTLLIAGESDESLGPDAQRRLALPHLAVGRLETIPGAGHLLPLEAAREVASLLAAHLQASAAVTMEKADAAYQALIASSRVSTRTRDVLQERGQPDDPSYCPAAMDETQFATLRALLDRVLPQRGEKIDLAARIDASLAQGAPRGWRFAALPRDDEACRRGLDTLEGAARAQHGLPFSALPARSQDATIEAAASAMPDAPQFALWLEDITAFAVEATMSHPATLARIGYSGIAYGGDGEPKSGFRLVGAGEREGWEPEAQPVPVP